MLSEAENPRKWRFTWEAQSHHPTLKLFLFSHHTNPKLHCRCLDISLDLTRNVIRVTYVAVDEEEVSMWVPVPRVLIDGESPLSFKAMDDYIEVKITLLLPVDHPIISGFDAMLNLSEDGGGSTLLDDGKPLSMDTDVGNLSSNGGVHFYCRSCSTKLTRRPISHFVEMPSVNWQEAADNWFGGCCCSFGGVSEKLVGKYARSHAASDGICLLDSTTAIVCMGDLLTWESPQLETGKNDERMSLLGDNDGLGESFVDSGSADGRNKTYDDLKERLPTLPEKPCSLLLDDCQSAKNVFATSEDKTIDQGLSHQVPDSNLTEGESVEPRHIQETTVVSSCKSDDCTCHVLDNEFDHLTFTKETELLENQKSFLNGFLGNVFMASHYNLSRSVEWIEFVCPCCSALLGAYPCTESCAPLDGGVRLFKCYISTGLPVLGSSDMFKKYTLERMFTNQILQTAKDELSYRTLIMDLKTRSPVLQIVLLNPNSWHCTGHCLDVGLPESSCKMPLLPAVKVLFCDVRNTTLSQQKMVEEWSAKHLADEVFMLRRQIEALVASLVSAKETFPSSFTVLQGFILSSMRR